MGRLPPLIYSDAKAYTSFAPYNKPGTIPLAYGANVELGCPHDCGLCPEHEARTNTAAFQQRMQELAWISTARNSANVALNSI